MANRRTVLVTIVGPGGGQRDLSLPADAPLKELLPPLSEITGTPSRGEKGPGAGWTLASSTGEVIASDSSLADASVLDGAVLYLTPARPDARPAPPPAPASVNDSLTPIERSSLVLPVRRDFGQRLGTTIKAFFRSDEIPAQPSPVHRADMDPAVMVRPTPSNLTLERSHSPIERARWAWRLSDYLEQLTIRIMEPRLRRPVTIAMMSPKGGVGKTTITALLGMLLSQLRRDRVIAIDTNPDYGSLGRVLVPTSSVYVDDLLARLDQPGISLTELDAQLGRAAHGLMVLPAPTDPERMAKLDEEAYASVIRRLKDFAGILVLDCGTGLQDPAARAAISSADQLVLVTDEQPAAASLVAEAGSLLQRSGRPITLAVNKMPTKGNVLNVDLLSGLIPQARGLVIVPREMNAASQLALGEFDWVYAPRSWQEAIGQLALVLMSDWPRLGLTL